MPFYFVQVREDTSGRDTRDQDAQQVIDAWTPKVILKAGGGGGSRKTTADETVVPRAGPDPETLKHQPYDSYD